MLISRAGTAPMVSDPDGVKLDHAKTISTDDSLNISSARKPLTGHLTLRIHQVADVDHAATGRFSRGPETFVIMKVEDVFKGRTKATRNDRWTDEVHEFDIDKANEIELTVYDRTGDHPLPIGMLWIRISDIAEEMRRKRIETELNSSSAMWVSADKMGAGGAGQSEMQFQPPPGQAQAASGPGGVGAGSGQDMGGAGPQPQTGPIYIDAWFALEPVGRIQLTMSFGEFWCKSEACAKLTVSQPSKSKIVGLSISVSTARVPFVSAKRRSTNSTVTSSSNSSSTTLCGVLFVATSSSMRPACNVQTANTLATRSATKRWSPSVSLNPMRRRIRTRPNSTTVFLTASSPSPIWAPTGAATVVMYYRLARNSAGSAQVRTAV